MDNDPKSDRVIDMDEEICKSGGPYYFGKIFLDFAAHESQKEILLDKSKYKIIAAGRRFGKSKMAAVDILHHAFFGEYNPNTQYIISKSQDQANIIFNECYSFASNSPRLRNRITKVIWTPFPELRFDNGSSIHARSTSYDGKYLRGHAAHRIVVDEAAYIKDDTIKQVIIPMLTDFNGDLILISTPNGRNYFYEMFNKAKGGAIGHAGWQFDSFKNPHISHEFINEQKALLLDLQFRTEYLAEFIDDQNNVFKWIYINDSLEDYEEIFRPEQGHHYYLGIDVAKQHDFTAISVLDGTNPKQVRLVYTERFNNKSYEYIFERVSAIAIHFQPLKIIVDETGVGAGITEQIVQTFPQAEGFTFTQPSKVSLINTLKLGLEQRRLRISSANNHWINELRYYEYSFTKQGGVKMEAPSNQFDDCVISLALAFQCCSIPQTIPDVFGIERTGEAGAYANPYKAEQSLATKELIPAQYGDLIFIG